MAEEIAKAEEKSAKKESWFKRVGLTTWILVALVLGIGAGILFQVTDTVDIANRYIAPLGTIFLNLVKLIVVPLVIFSLVAGIISLSDIKKVSIIGGKTIAFYLCTTAVAVTLGVVFAMLLNVGMGYELPAEEFTYEAKTADPIDTLIGIFPSNIIAPLANATMLQIIVIALLFGFGMVALGKKVKPVADFCNSMNDVCIKVMQWIIAIAPIGVFGLIAPVIAKYGADVLLPLLWVIVVAYLVMILHTVVTYSAMIKIFSKMSLLKFFKNQLPAFGLAFASASSVGTLPVNMECNAKMGVSKEVTSFVLPLGATINMDGTAIYQGVCAIFLAQILGIDLTIGQILTIVLTAVVASIGTAGVPGSGMIMLAMVLESCGIPIAAIGLIYGVDRIFDMMRTAVNVTGDAACAVCVDASEIRRAEKAAAKKAA
ncbi:MAG: dicarboxylate/amino acid:cation symporter [Eggerthellaceae bacterium]|nr:dicarboxylate/amino acid:cation symporter [Eggerthellaceae bacterium]